MATESHFKDLKNGISSALIDTTRTAGQISNEDLAFHRSSNPSVIPLLEQQNTRLLQLAQKLTRIATSGTELSAPQISDGDSVEDNWKVIVDVFDNLLEKADARHRNKRSRSPLEGGQLARLIALRPLLSRSCCSQKSLKTTNLHLSNLYYVQNLMLLRRSKEAFHWFPLKMGLCSMPYNFVSLRKRPPNPPRILLTLSLGISIHTKSKLSKRNTQPRLT